MKIPQRAKPFFLCFMLFTAALRCQAQHFTLSVSNSANPVLINNDVTFFINVTNDSGFPVQNLIVTNAFSVSGSAKLLSAQSSQGLIATNTGGFVFSLGDLPPGFVAQMSTTLTPISAGFITNVITAFAPLLTNVIVTNVVQAINPPPAQTDLAVSIAPPIFSTVVGDYISYTISVTNRGSNSASSVILSNTATAFLKVIDISPPSLTGTFTNHALLLNLGTLTNQESKTVRLTVWPTNAGPLTLAAAVEAPGSADSNPGDNTATTTIAVEDFLPGNLGVSLVSPSQTFNPITGLMEQTIRLTNEGTNTVPAARVSVMNPPFQLFNAAGTNRAPDSLDANPFVILSRSLDVGESVDLRMEYLVPTGLPFPISTNQFTAAAVPMPDLTPGALGAPVSASRIFRLDSGEMLIEFPSVPGRSYTILYSDDMQFSNPLVAPPSIIAPANRVQWLDYGPPTTSSLPATNTSRFYRVYLNP